MVNQSWKIFSSIFVDRWVNVLYNKNVNINNIITHFVCKSYIINYKHTVQKNESLKNVYYNILFKEK